MDDHEEVSAALGVTAMPTFIAFRAGKEIGRVRGARPDQLKVCLLSVSVLGMK